MSLEFSVAEIIGTQGVKFMKLFGQFNDERDAFELMVPRVISGELLVSLLEKLSNKPKEDL